MRYTTYKHPKGRAMPCKAMRYDTARGWCISFIRHLLLFARRSFDSVSFKAPTYAPRRWSQAPENQHIPSGRGGLSLLLLLLLLLLQLPLLLRMAAQAPPPFHWNVLDDSPSRAECAGGPHRRGASSHRACTSTYSNVLCN